MTSPCIGRLNTIVTGGDRRITRAEFTALETAVFADGIAEEVEVQLLARLLDPRAGYRFADSSDAVRLRTMIDGRAFNWALYRAALHEINLAPRLRDEEQAVLQRNGYADQRAHVVRVTRSPSGVWRIRLQKQGRIVTWEYREQGLALSKFLQSRRGISVGEIFLALCDLLAQLPPHERAPVQGAIAAIARGLRDAPYARAEYHAYYNAGRRFADAMSARVANETITQRVPIGAYPFFAGDLPTPDIRDALEHALDQLFAVCPGLYDCLIAHGFLIDLYSWARITRAATAFDEPPRPTGGYSPDLHATQVNIDLDPQAVAFVLIHEIGHFLIRLFHNAQQEFDTEYVDAVLAHYFIHLRQWSATTRADRFPRRYAATADYEWFPDAFAIAVLGDSSLAFRAGLHAAISGQAIGYAALLSDFHTRDPIGTRLVEDVLQMFTHPMPWPTTALTSERLGALMHDPDEGAFFARTQLVVDAVQHGTITPELLQRFDDLITRHLYDRTLKAAFQQLLTRADVAPAQRAQSTALARRLARMLPDDDELARLYATALQQQREFVAAYRVLARFEQRTRIDMDTAQEAIAVAALLAPATQSTQAYFHQHAGLLLITRLMNLAEHAARAPRVRPPRPGESPTPRVAPPNIPHAFLALDAAVPARVIRRARATQPGRLLRDAVQRLVDRCAADGAIAPAMLAQLRAKYGLKKVQE